MEEIIGIIFALLVFVGPLLLKMIGGIFEAITAPEKQPPQQRSSNQSEFEERLRRHRQRQQQREQPLEAPVVAEVVPPAVFDSSPVLERDAYYNPTEHLDDPIELRDDRMDQHLHETFDHQLGSLRSVSANRVQEDVLNTEPDKVAGRQNLAAGIAAMMRSQNDLRKAFILGEILHRPANFDRRLPR